MNSVMAQYEWRGQSLISYLKEVDTGKSHYIEIGAAPEAEPGELAGLNRMLADQGWFSVADSDENGKPTLRIYGYNDPSNVVNYLEKQNFVSGSAKISGSFQRKEKKKDTLISSGWFYYLGDLLFFAGGKYQANKDISVGSAIKALSSGLLIYGRSVNPDNPLHRFVEQTSKELSAQGINVEDYKNADELSTKLESSKSFKQKFDQFLSDYSVETLIGINTIGDFFFTKSGKGSEKKKSRNYGVITQGGIGLATSVNLFIARTMMENRHKMDPEGTLFKVTNALEKSALPLRAAGNTLGNLISIFESFRGAVNLYREVPYADMKKDERHDFFGNLLIAAANLTFLAGNIQYGRGKQKKETPYDMEEASAAVANMLQTMPREKKLEAVDKVATFFATQDPEQRSVEEHKEILFDKIERLKDSPFVAHSRAKIVPMQKSPGYAMSA